MSVLIKLKQYNYVDQEYKLCSFDGNEIQLEIREPYWRCRDRASPFVITFTKITSERAINYMTDCLKLNAIIIEYEHLRITLSNLDAYADSEKRLIGEKVFFHFTSKVMDVY